MCDGSNCEITIRGNRQSIEMAKQMIREIAVGRSTYAGGAGIGSGGGGGGYQQQGYGYQQRAQRQPQYGYAARPGQQDYDQPHYIWTTARNSQVHHNGTNAATGNYGQQQQQQYPQAMVSRRAAPVALEPLFRMEMQLPRMVKFTTTERSGATVGKNQQQGCRKEN
jgi:hypothetical protein